MKDIAKLASSINSWTQLKQDFDDLYELVHLAKSENDESLLNDIKNSIQSLQHKHDEISLRHKLSGENDINNAIVTLHAGAGGTEACDWTEMLVRMYHQWAEKRAYSTEIINILPGEEAGIKSITFMVRGEYSYGYLKSEIGVHRLVRISPFDSNKRRHTSFASCDIIPEINEDIEIIIDDKDLRIDTYRASGHGGQHVNKTDSAVRITHIPTNIVVQCQNERSQHKNKALALKLLKARLYEAEQEKRRAAQEKHYNDKGDIAWGNQIRSYVFCPYTMVKDHRTGVEVGNIDSVMDGNIDKFIEAYLEKKI